MSSYSSERARSNSLGMMLGLAFAAASPAWAQLPAFPGAEGFGSTTPGGRGGDVYIVTNLNNSGPGSFREACLASGPRIVVFSVGGEIKLSSAIIVTNPYITIAGQTAPGGGITIRNDGTSEEDTLIFNAHDIIIRYIRSRPGPSDDPTTGCDALSFEGDTHDAIADHCSLSWDVDETFELWPNPHDITLQWSIVSESLHCSSHAQGCHSKGLLLGTEGARDISVHHCLLAHHDERNPRVGNSGLVDFVNNIVYDPDAMCGMTNEFVQQPINYVGNYVKKGPFSKDVGPDGLERFEIMARDESGLGFSIYVEGNIGPHRPDHTYPEEVVVETPARVWVTETRHPAPAITTYEATESRDRVLGEAGANRPYRDPIDSRIVRDVINGTGTVINDPSEVGGYPPIPSGTPRIDSDEDGMPDDWENTHGLDPQDPSDSADDRDGDGYTNIEEWFNGLVDCGGTDGDGDHVRDLCDNCPAAGNIDQLDTDADGLGDVCDPDDDGDLVDDIDDNCPREANTDQTDGDHDDVGDFCDACPNTAVTIPVDDAGCPVVQVRCDMDDDGDVDLDDYGQFQICFSGNTTAQNDPACDDAKLDLDADVDGLDLTIFLNCFTGASVVPTEGCDDAS